MVYMSHAEGDQVLPNLYPKASISIDKVWQSMLLGTPFFMAGHITLVATQAKKIDENRCPITKRHTTMMGQVTKHMISTWM